LAVAAPNSACNRCSCFKSASTIASARRRAICAGVSSGFVSGRAAAAAEEEEDGGGTDWLRSVAFEPCCACCCCDDDPAGEGDDERDGGFCAEAPCLFNMRSSACCMAKSASASLLLAAAALALAPRLEAGLASEAAFAAAAFLLSRPRKSAAEDECRAAAGAPPVRDAACATASEAPAPACERVNCVRCTALLLCKREGKGAAAVVLPQVHAL